MKMQVAPEIHALVDQLPGENYIVLTQEEAAVLVRPNGLLARTGEGPSLRELVLTVVGETQRLFVFCLDTRIQSHLRQVQPQDALEKSFLQLVMNA